MTSTDKLQSAGTSATSWPGPGGPPTCRLGATTSGTIRATTSGTTRAGSLFRTLTPHRELREPAAAARTGAGSTPGPSGSSRGRSRTATRPGPATRRSEEHTSELQSLAYLVCRLLLEKKKKNKITHTSEKKTKNQD